MEQETLRGWKARSFWATLLAAGSAIWLLIDPTAEEQAGELKDNGPDVIIGVIGSLAGVWAWLERVFGKKKLTL